MDFMIVKIPTFAKKINHTSRYPAIKPSMNMFFEIFQPGELLRWKLEMPRHVGGQ